MLKWKTWLYTFIAGMIGSVASAVLSALAMPDVFNFTHDGWVHLAKMMIIAAVTSASTFLKQSPLPPEDNV